MPSPRQLHKEELRWMSSSSRTLRTQLLNLLTFLEKMEKHEGSFTTLPISDQELWIELQSTDLCTSLRLIAEHIEKVLPHYPDPVAFRKTISGLFGG